MLAAASKLFIPTSRIAKLDRLAARMNPRNNRERIRTHRFLSSLDPAVLDAFRITTCFENLFKARLLLDGYVIHCVNRKTHSSLANRQLKKPVRILDIKKAEGLMGRVRSGYTFASLLPHTIGLSILVQKPAYRAQLRLPDRLFTALRSFANKRNTLHFLAIDVSVYNTGVVDDLRYIRTCFNRFVVRRHNRLLRSLGFSHLRSLSEIA